MSRARAFVMSPAAGTTHAGAHSLGDTFLFVFAFAAKRRAYMTNKVEVGSEDRCERLTGVFAMFMVDAGMELVSGERA